jgi:hypothetical protein
VGDDKTNGGLAMLDIKRVVVLLSALGVAFGGGTVVSGGTSSTPVDVGLAASIARIESKLDAVTERVDDICDHVSSVDDDLTALRVKIAPLFRPGMVVE